MLIQLAISQHPQQTLPQVCQGHFTCEVLLKGGAEHHELIDQMGHLQALIIIFGGLPTEAREFVL